MRLERIRGPGELLIRAHRFAESLRPILGRTAPYSEASLRAIPPPLSSEAAVGAGAYLGEVLCRNLGGSWVAPQGLDSEIEPFIILNADRRRVNPFAPFLFTAKPRLSPDRTYLALCGLSFRRALHHGPPNRRRWLELLIEDLDGDPATVAAVLTEFVTVRAAEVLPLLATLPASVGRFDDLLEGWRLAEHLTRAGALVETRDILLEGPGAD